MLQYAQGHGPESRHEGCRVPLPYTSDTSEHFDYCVCRCSGSRGSGGGRAVGGLDVVLVGLFLLCVATVDLLGFDEVEDGEEEQVRDEREVEWTREHCCFGNRRIGFELVIERYALWWPKLVLSDLNMEARVWKSSQAV